MTKTKLKTYSLWGIQILLALAFLAAGGAKLAGVEKMVMLFDQIGYGQWFRYLTGGLEVAGAILILIPKTAKFAAAMLACIMVGAIGTHLFLIGGSFVPALVLGVLCVIVSYAKFKKEKEAMA